MTQGREIPSPPIRLHDIREACSACGLSELCLPVALESHDVDTLDRIVQRSRPLQKGDTLYRAGLPFLALYAVRTGCLKTSSLAEDGEEQITAFHLPGELIGLDAISFDTHPSTAEALETTRVCEIPFNKLEDISRNIPGLQRQLLRIMSREIFAENEMLHALAKRTAEQRLAIVLISLGDRYARRGLSPTHYRLPMSRHDLSNYLGLAPETLSRLFRRFVEQSWITTSGRDITLTDVPALREMTGNASATPRQSDRR